MGENIQGCNLGTGARPGPWGKKELSPWVGDHITQQRLLSNPQQSPWCFPHKLYWLTTHDSQRQDSSVVRALGWRSGDMGFIQLCDFLQDSGWAVLPLWDSMSSSILWGFGFGGPWDLSKPWQLSCSRLALRPAFRVCLNPPQLRNIIGTEVLVRISFFFWGCLLSNKIYLVVNLWLWC